jgi:RimJ/RimL family protein N-acetyltransferase
MEKTGAKKFHGGSKNEEDSTFQMSHTLISTAHQFNAAINTLRLALEPMCERHAEFFFEPLQEEYLYEWISMTKPPTLEWLRARWRGIEQRLSKDGHTACVAWAVRREIDGKYVGRVDAEINKALEAENFGYYFFHPYWGQGYATEAVTAATQHLIAHGVHRLVATVTVGNTASARVLQKAGYDFTRLLIGNDVLRGQPVDDWEYVVTA